jgi:hypothetical protein
MEGAGPGLRHPIQFLRAEGQRHSQLSASAIPG